MEGFRHFNFKLTSFSVSDSFHLPIPLLLCDGSHNFLSFPIRFFHHFMDILHARTDAPTNRSTMATIGIGGCKKWKILQSKSATNFSLVHSLFSISSAFVRHQLWHEFFSLTLTPIVQQLFHFCAEHHWNCLYSFFFLFLSFLSFVVRLVSSPPLRFIQSHVQ